MKNKIIYSLVGIVIAYYILGIVLVETGIANKWWVFPNTVLMDKHNSLDNDTSLLENDGPYVFYNQDRIVVKAINGLDTMLAYQVDTFPITEKKNISINCTFKNSLFNFSTRLKDTLKNEEIEYSNVQKIIAISDIEGNFNAFRNLLLANEIIDSAYNWTFGNGHLVLPGDFFDRGLNVTECLWLIYDLEEKAKLYGGYVHYILGNHEIMNMSGDLRYVRKKYFENSTFIKEDYKNLYTSATELGRWLATKNVIEKINDIVFTHGGISEEINSLNISLFELNNLSRNYYFNSVKGEGNYDKKVSILYNSKTSPFWYRGYIQQEADENQVIQTLQQYNANNIIVGHTLVDQVSTFYGGKVVAIDTKHADNVSEGLLIENGKFYRIDNTGKRQKIN